MQCDKAVLDTVAFYRDYMVNFNKDNQKGKLNEKASRKLNIKNLQQNPTKRQKNHEDINSLKREEVIVMETKTIYEEEILKEIRDLSEPLQKKLFKIVHLLKQEIIKPEYDEKLATEEFLSICGTWEDDRTVEEQIKDIYSSRKSTVRTGDIF